MSHVQCKQKRRRGVEEVGGRVYRTLLGWEYEKV